jgi:hypothetical protein
MGDILLPGLADTLHQAQASQRLMKGFLQSLKRNGFTKVESWWLGPEAMQMLRGGKRLTKTAVQSPPEFDLKFPEELSAR